MFIHHKVFPVAVSGMITLPVSAQMYQAMVQHQIPNSDGTVCLTPMQVPNFVSNNSSSEGNLNSTFIMTSNNRNTVNTLTNQSAITKCHMKSIQSQSEQYGSNSKKQKTKKKTIIKTKKVIELLNSVYPSLNPTSSNNNKTIVKNKNFKSPNLTLFADTAKSHWKKIKYSSSKECNTSIILD